MKTVEHGKRIHRLATLVGVAASVLGALLIVACGGDEQGTGTTTTTASQPATSTAPKLSGTFEIDGSSTVFPITEAVAEEFHNAYPKVRVNVGVSGTGGGFKRFTVGDTVISNASRPIRDSEAQAAADNSIEYLELRVAVDGLSVMVNPSNDFVDCLTVEALGNIWKPDSTVKTWKDVNPAWPDDEIRLYGPGTDSGTFDYFTEEIVGEVRASRSDYLASEDDNFLVQGIYGDRNSLGYFGYAYYSENPDKLKLVAIDDGAGCIPPTPETIEDGTYTPLSRPLSIYVNKAALDRPEVKAFVEFYMENAAELATEVGYVRLSESEYAANLGMVR